MLVHTDYHLHSAPYNRNDREVCLILWVKYSQFFAFHLSLYTNDTMSSSRVMISFEFCSSKDFRNSSSSRLTDCSLSMLKDGDTSPRILEKRFSMTSSEKKKNRNISW